MKQTPVFGIITPTTKYKDLKFNYSIYIDIIYINNSLILYIIDKAIYFQATR